jgi:hypothetical protein
VTERRAAARALLLACATLGPAALAALAALAAPVAAQEQTFTVPADPSAPREQAITIVSDATAGARRPGGFGWVRVEAFNPDVASHEVELGVGDRSSLGGAHARRVVRLGPGERAALSLPVPYANWLNELVVRVDGGEPASSNIVAAVPGSTSTLPSILALTDDASFGALLRARAEIEMPVLVDSGTLTGFVVKRVRDLPDAWQMLSAFDVIVLDARSDFLRPESQQVLADWVAAGGRLVVAGEAPSGDAPLAAMLDDAPRTPGTHGRAGLGQWMLAPRNEQCLGQDVMQWLRAPELPGLGRSFSGLPHDGLASHLVIPGVGKVPRRQFLLLILAFIVAIGVITLMQVRRKRHGRLLVVVPGTGMAFTFALLAYGYLSEGLGIKGVVRSVTLLDQRRHEAVDVAQRTVYAGLQPDEPAARAGHAARLVGPVPGFRRAAPAPPRARADQRLGRRQPGAARAPADEPRDGQRVPAARAAAAAARGAAAPDDRARRRAAPVGRARLVAGARLPGRVVGEHGRPHPAADRPRRAAAPAGPPPRGVPAARGGHRGRVERERRGLRRPRARREYPVAGARLADAARPARLGGRLRERGAAAGQLPGERGGRSLRRRPGPDGALGVERAPRRRPPRAGGPA